MAKTNIGDNAVSFRDRNSDNDANWSATTRKQTKKERRRQKRQKRQSEFEESNIIDDTNAVSDNARSSTPSSSMVDEDDRAKIEVPLDNATHPLDSASRSGSQIIPLSEMRSRKPVSKRFHERVDGLEHLCEDYPFKFSKTLVYS
jgi:hypothetical protein